MYLSPNIFCILTPLGTYGVLCLEYSVLILQGFLNPFLIYPVECLLCFYETTNTLPLIIITHKTIITHSDTFLTPSLLGRP
jgi:hypothetical protein